jgi:hypothetical protein
MVAALPRCMNCAAWDEEARPSTFRHISLALSHEDVVMYYLSNPARSQQNKSAIMLSVVIVKQTNLL